MWEFHWESGVRIGTKLRERFESEPFGISLGYEPFGIGLIGSPKAWCVVVARRQGEFSGFNVISQSKTARLGTQTVRAESRFVSMTGKPTEKQNKPYLQGGGRLGGRRGVKGRVKVKTSRSMGMKYR